MRKIATLVILGALAAAGARADPSSSRSSQSPLLQPARVASADTAPPFRTELTKQDADAWFDGFMPNALAQGDIAGGVVVVVKDGKILTQRGYGYADIAARRRVDPATTMFRVGSTSKLFTWTAVMQLVEQGKIDLDADVNRYLDFTIPPFEGKPLTMRAIMTHTSGFEDVVKGGFSYSGKVEPLGTVVKNLLPRRVFAPGSTPAYSNYATALAGYIVERVSGLPFDTYVERRIFQPLGMDHSSFRQPLPASLAPYMATGYSRASGEARPFELISVPPAGSLSMSGTDGAKFMIAQLNDGAGLMRPQTARVMQTPAYGALPALNRMALGFYEQRVNGLRAIAHGGDLINFHGYMWLFPEKNVGLMIEMNSAGEEGATSRIRQALFERFADRYFPAASDKPPVELPTAREHARMLAGNYFNSRAQFTTFLDIGNFLGQTSVGLDADGRPQVPELFGGPPRKWIEVAPFVWQDAYGHARLAARVNGGRVTRWSLDEVSPFMVFERVPWYRDSAWLMPLTLAALAIILIAALYWPTSAIVRRRFAVSLSLTGKHRTAYRLVSGMSWLVMLACLGWAYVLLVFLESLSKEDWPVLLCRLLGTIAFAGMPIAAAWNLALTWTRRPPWLQRLASLLLLIAALVLFWVAAEFHLLGLGTRY